MYMNIPDHIQELIRKYDQGLLSEAEKKELDAWYHSFDDQQTVVSDFPEGSVTRLSDRIMLRLEETLSQEQNQMEPLTEKASRKWAIPSVAALIIILLSGGIYYFIQTDNAKLPQPLALSAPVPAGDVAPGGNKAILTLDDGSVIMLDSENNGILGEQGGV